MIPIVMLCDFSTVSFVIVIPFKWIENKKKCTQNNTKTFQFDVFIKFDNITALDYNPISYSEKKSPTTTTTTFIDTHVIS